VPPKAQPEVRKRHVQWTRRLGYSRVRRTRSNDRTDVRVTSLRYFSPSSSLGMSGKCIKLQPKMIDALVSAGTTEKIIALVQSRANIRIGRRAIVRIVSVAGRLGLKEVPAVHVRLRSWPIAP
jgi:hypothetical protein